MRTQTAQTGPKSMIKDFTLSRWFCINPGIVAWEKNSTICSITLQPTEVFSGDVLEFGTEVSALKIEIEVEFVISLRKFFVQKPDLQVQTTSSHIRPLRIQVKLIQPDGRQAGQREDEVAFSHPNSES